MEGEKRRKGEGLRVGDREGEKTGEGEINGHGEERKEKKTWMFCK